jgi:hypothetical protein
MGRIVAIVVVKSEEGVMSERLAISRCAFVLAALAAPAHAQCPGDTPTSRLPFSLHVFKADVFPTKSDGHSWDGVHLLKGLPDPKGFSPMMLAAAATKKIVEAGIDATAAPDVYVVVEANGKKFQSNVKQDTYQAAWGNDEGETTFELRPGDVLQLRVIDQDLQENTKDIIGSNLHTVTSSELASGVVHVEDFDQVQVLDLVIAPVAKQALSFAPGRYRVTVEGATISATKPAGVKDAGKSWDALGDPPDTAGTVTVGGVSMVLPKVQDTLAPKWAVTVDVDLDEASSFSASLVDKDLSGEKGDDPIGTVSVPQLLAAVPASDGKLHLGNQAAIVELVVQITPVVPAPIGETDCRALFEHISKLAAAESKPDVAEQFRTASEERMRACQSSTSQARLQCGLKATDLASFDVCKSVR